MDDLPLLSRSQHVQNGEPQQTHLFNPMNSSLDLTGGCPMVNELAAESGAASWPAPWSSRVSICLS